MFKTPEEAQEHYRAKNKWRKGQRVFHGDTYERDEYQSPDLWPYVPPTFFVVHKVYDDGLSLEKVATERKREGNDLIYTPKWDKVEGYLWIGFDFKLKPFDENYEFFTVLTR